MRNRIIYGILKSYKGIFTKKHIGNVQILILEMEDYFWVLNLLGSLENGNEMSQLLLRAQSQYIGDFIDNFESSEKFIQLEEIFCNSIKENQQKMKILLKKKGKHINSNLIINFSPEYSRGNIRLYEIQGKFKLVENDIIMNKAQLTMKSIKKNVIAKPLITKFLSLIKR